MMPDHAIKKSSSLLFLLSWLLLSSFTIAGGGIGIDTSKAKNNDIKCIDNEREALLKFKDGIEVDRCGLLASWGNNQEQNKDCCKWSGVGCNNHTGNVIMLDIHGTNTGNSLGEPCLEGKISASLVELKHLNYLDLSYNDFQGQPIPSFIGSLIKLKHLNLSHTGFGGRVPNQLGHLSNLLSLHLSCTPIYPYCLHVENLQWLSHLTSLSYIDFSYIDLSSAIDWIPVINSLPSLTFVRMETCRLPSPALQIMSYPQMNSSVSLRVLDLGNNHLNSSIYQWLFNSSSRFATHLVEKISLRQNQLEGPIPEELGNLPALRYLDLSTNRIECPLPDTIGTLKRLAHLDLSHNKLQGCTLPETFDKLCSLRSLFLSDISLKEELPNFIQRLSAQKSLAVLDLSGNQLWGSIPNTIDTFPSLREFYVDDNLLNGTVSESIGQLSKLERFSISSNTLNDTLSNQHFEKLSRLQYLDLSNNSLLGHDFTPDWVPPFQLDTIRLQSCRLGPHFPKWIQSQRSFSHLDLSNAGISETIPSSFWNLLTPRLSYLNLSRNHIPGTLPDLPISFDHLDPPDIDLSSNSFEGTIPSFLGNVSSLSLNDNKFSNPMPLLCSRSRVALYDLDLSDNMLSGVLPHDCWVHMDQLSFLNLETNRFSGKLPTSLGSLEQLQSFRLCDNSFSGELPAALWNCTSLVILDIGDNHFSGYIPPGIGGILQNLVVLNLRKNKFHGSIPLSLCKLSNLQMLDLSGNGITGTIPKCIQNFTGMTNETNFLSHFSPNSSQRRVIYPYAAWVKWKRVQQKFGSLLGMVKSFDVSDNQLEGEIPTEISFLAGLVSIDLSRNHLVGSITPQIGQLTSLEFLDLSNNHLSGEIPTSLASLSYLGVLDLSNNSLSGMIPIGTQLQSFNASAYMGNPELCGAPLPNKCPGDQAPTSMPKEESQTDEGGDNDIFPGLYISIMLGAIVGFWGVCGPLALKQSWRNAYFQFLDMLYANIARFWRKP